MRRFGTKKSRFCGFTLVELMVSLSITGIILGSVTAFAFAVGAATEKSDDLSSSQEQVRCAVLRVGELLRNSRMVCYVNSVDLVLWESDINGDGKINPREVVYIQKDNTLRKLSMTRFTGATYVLALSNMLNNSSKSYLYTSCSPRTVVLIEGSFNMNYTIDAWPADTNFVSFGFEINEGGEDIYYEVSGAVMSGG